MSTTENSPTAKIDISPFYPSLESDSPTSNEILTLHEQAQGLLDRNGVNSFVNEMPAIVTEACAAVEGPKGEVLYARIFKQLPTAKRKQKYQEDLLFGIAFDQDPDIKVRTKNSRAVLFKIINGSASLYVDGASLDGIEVDKPEHFEAAYRVVSQISSEVDSLEAQKSLDMERQKQQAIDEKLQRKTNRSRARSRAVNKFKDGVSDTVDLALEFWPAIVIVGGIASLATVAVVNGGDESNVINSEDIAEAPVVIKIGDQNINPAFSPSMIGDDKWTGMSTSEESELSVRDNIIRVELISSKEGKNCETIDTKGSIDSEILAWSPRSNLDGTSASKDIEITRTVNYVEVCFAGQESSDDDDPSVYIQLVEPQISNSDASES